jgi:holo-[acyl-carrier protein] synthase
MIRKPARHAKSAPAGILGTGIDLVENERMRASLTRLGARFKNRVFCDREQSYCDAKVDAARHYAGRFAVKEAVAKAFGTGIGAHLGLLDIEVTRDEQSGAPSVCLNGKARGYARRRGVTAIHISLTHTRDFAVAHAIIVGTPSRRKTDGGRRRTEE